MDVMDKAADRLHSTSAMMGENHLAIQYLREARAAVAELIEATKAVADEHFGPLAHTDYYDEDDEVGTRVCCGVLSYKPHTAVCPAVRLRAALAKVEGGAS